MKGVVKPLDIRKKLTLYAITDRHWIGEKTLLEQVEETLKGGATCLQCREKNLDHQAFLEEAKAIQKLCRAYHVPFFIDDDVDLAIEIHADGVHVGQKDLYSGIVREKIGKEMLLGVSASNVKEALEAEHNGADYLGVGAVFPTSTKKDAESVDKVTLKTICDAVSIPVVAIGGITLDNIQELKGTGIDGVAVISAIFASKDIQKTTEDLLSQTELMLKG